MDDLTAAPLSVAAIQDGLTTRLLGRRVVYRESVGSTNDLARELADGGEPEGTLVITDEQRAGRGRLARAWIAPARSSVLMSLILRPVLAPHQLAHVTMAVAIGACDTLGGLGLDAWIKWPNDILVRGRKCAGVLAEAQITGDRLDCAIVGMGLNVNFAAAQVAGIPPDATTLADELGHPVSRVRLVQAILTSVEPFYLRLQAGESLQSEWTARLATLNRRVRAHTPWGDEAGVAERADEDGALWLRRDDGSAVQLVAGDVTLAKE